MSMQLLRNLVMIDAKPLHLNTTDSGIVIPTSVNEGVPRKAVILEAGPGDYDKKGKFIENPVQKGDIVYYVPNNATELSHDGKDYVLFSSDDVLVKVPQ